MLKAATKYSTGSKSNTTSLFQYNEKGKDTFFQPKLNVGTAGDKFEIEADNAADQVVEQSKQTEQSFFAPSISSPESVNSGQPAPVQHKNVAENITPLVQKQEEEEEMMQMQPFQEEEEIVQSQVNEEKETIQQQPEEEETEPLQMQPTEEEMVQSQVNKEDETLQQQQDESNEILKSETAGEETFKAQPKNGQQYVQKQPENTIQKQEVEEDEPLEVQPSEDEEFRSELAEKEGQIQANADNAPVIPAGFEYGLNGSKGNGSPLPSGVKNQMESGFGTDFSNVRIHTDSGAIKMNKKIGAQAFTHGSDIYFNEGKYRTESDSGKHLLAHELTHTVQQGGGKSKVQKSDEETPEEKIRRLISDEDSDGIVSLTDEELRVSTAAQRAGMIRIILDLLWVNYTEERAAVHILRFNGQGDQVLPLIDAIGYRQSFLDSVDNSELKEVLISTIAQVNVNSEGGDLAIATILANPESNYESVMTIQNFGSATNNQRLGLMQIMLSMNWSNKPEEDKMIAILESSGEGLGELMNLIAGVGLKQSLFDHIDDEENALHFTQLLGGLNNPVLNSDLEVFNRGFWGNLGEGIWGGLVSAWDNFSLGSIIMGFLHPIIHPIDSIVALIMQIVEIVRDFDFSLNTLDRIVTVLRDTAGFIVMWLLVLSLIASGIAALVAIGVITLPASIPIAAIAAALWSYTAIVGIVFIVLAIIKLIIDLIQAGVSTTSRELEREEEDLGEDFTLLGVILAVAGMFKGMKWAVERFRRGAVDPDAAKPETLDETSREVDAEVDRGNEKAAEAEDGANEARDRANERPAAEEPGPVEEGRGREVEEANPDKVSPEEIIRRKEELSKDPQTGEANPKSISEAETILQAESEGIVNNARRPNLERGEPNLDFVVDGPSPYKYVDVKTPVNRGDLAAQATSIGKKSYLQKGGAQDVMHIIDLKNIPSGAKPKFVSDVIKGANDAAGANAPVEGIVFINN